jgi:hypothetical protein
MVHILPNQEHLEKEFPITQLPGVKKYKRAILEHSIIGNQINKLLGTNSGASIVTVWSVIFRFVNDLLAFQQGTDFDEKLFDEKFNSMMEFFKSDTIQVQMIATLENFDCDEDIIDLPRGWRIERVPDEIRKEWWSSQTKISLSFGPREHLWASFVLVKEYETKRRILSSTSPHKESDSQLDGTLRTNLLGEIVVFISGLRMLKLGRVIHRVTRERVLGWSVGSPGGSFSWKSHIPEIRGMQYKLNGADATELRQIIETLHQTASENAFQVALRRLNLIIERGDTNDADKILDSMIGLESLFLGGQRGELKYRLSMRSAAFLGISFEEKEQIRDDIQYIYDLRSYIIHGYQKDTVDKHLRKRDMGLRQVANLSEEYLRKALKGFLKELQNGKKVEDVLSAIDDTFLR